MFFLKIFIGLVIFSLYNLICHILCVLFFYRINPKNDWYAENYKRLPKFLQIFD